MAIALEQYYPGDEIWFNYVSVFEDTWHGCSFQNLLLRQLHDHLDVAKVVYGVAENDALKWIYESIPALDGLTIETCASKKSLLLALRTMLLRVDF